MVIGREGKSCAKPLLTNASNDKPTKRLLGTRKAERKKWETLGFKAGMVFSKSLAWLNQSAITISSSPAWVHQLNPS